MLFNRADLDRIATGEITVAFRRWLRPTVRAGGTREPYRVAFRLAGPDPRIALRENADLSDAEIAAVSERLARLDARSQHGPWTDAVLDLIERNPGTRAADLAERLDRERLSFKADVRKLKGLGLTESLETGYRISPRGRCVMQARR